MLDMTNDKIIQFGWSLNKGSLDREVLRIKFMVDAIFFLFVTG